MFTTPLAAFLALIAISFYVFVYTMALKRRTSQNIVWGGAAGCMPVLIGWAAVTNSLSLTALAFFMVIFFWTPPHFWALALFMKADYHDAGVPMLTVTHGRTSTRKHILIYTVPLVILAVGTGFTAIGGPVYLAIALVLKARFLKGAFDIWRRDEAQSDADGYAVEKKFFKRV